MLPNKASRPKKHILMPDLMAKGLEMLQNVAGRECQTPEWKYRQKQRSPSKSSQAVSRYYKKMSERNSKIGPKDISHRKDTSFDNPSSEDFGFLSEMEKLRKAFLLRPGCPQLNTRATSISQCGMTMAKPSSLPQELYKGSEDLKLTKDDLSSKQEDMKVDGLLLPYSKSSCELNYLLQRSQSTVLSSAISSPVVQQSTSRKRMPWYISVIHEKDHCLLTLGEEVHRLSELKVEMQKKDKEIQELQEEKEVLKKQLKYLLRSKSQDTTLSSGFRESHATSFFMGDEGEEAEEEIYENEEDLERVIKRASDEVSKSSVDSKESTPEIRGGQDDEEEEEVVVVQELDEEREMRDEEWRRSRSVDDDGFEEELMMQLGEFERVMQEFQFELEVTRTRYSLATGAIMSLQRQVDFQESQLQKINRENELLEKELRERKCQLQTMADKFSNLREEKKQVEMLGLIEKDNLTLRQQVSDLEKELAKRDETISEFNTKVNQLQEQVKQHQNHLQRWKQLQGDMQNRNEMMHQAEQQVRVALEGVQSRLEKLRSKIIQATFSTTGIKSQNTEISDNDILEALQTIITERTDYYNQLKQKGIKVPPMHQEILSSPNKSKKTALK